MKKLISVVEASERYGIGRNTLYFLLKTNPTVVPHIKIGSRVKINAPLFEEWLDKVTREGRQL